MQRDLKFLSVIVNVNVINFFDSRFIFLYRRKFFEIMFPNKQNCCLFHQIHIRSFERVINVFAFEYTWNFADRDAVHVYFGSCIQARMKALRFLLNISNRNIHRKIAVQVILNLDQGHICCSLKTCDLTVRMHANFSS